MSRIFIVLSFAIVMSSCGRGKPNLKSFADPSSQLLVQSCSGCHYTSNVHTPDINGLSRSEIEGGLKNYKSQAGGETVMHRLMRGYSQEEITVIAKTLGQDQ